MMVRWILPLAFVCALSGVLAGCGSDAESLSPTAAETAAPDAGGERTANVDGLICPLSVEEMAQALTPWTAGPITVDTDYSADYGCVYAWPEGSFDTSDFPDADLGDSFSISERFYADNRIMTISSSAGEWNYGGTTPQEVAETTLAANQASEDVVLTQRIDGYGAGLISDGLDLVLAADGDSWFEGGMSGYPGAGTVPIITAVADELLAAAAG
jgi:hypothetical protein